MRRILLLFLAGAGAGLLWAGTVQGGFSLVALHVLVPMLLLLFAAGFTLWHAAHRLARHWSGEIRLRFAGKKESPLAAKLTPLLFNDYTPYVVEAAETLGRERETTAVPALLRALECCADNQSPGWRDRAEALANALAAIGDGRALPVLYRLENVRGIGVIPAIRKAIASIEPQSSLLRPGSEDSALNETLLRPAHALSSDSDPALLLRATEREN